MRIMVIGSGGREHAICWKISQSPLCTALFAAPGNLGMEQCATLLDVALTDNQGLLKAALDNKIDLTVVGPDDVLAAGLVDLFTANGLAIFGPHKAAARLEWSKQYAKTFMDRYSIPTARWLSCSSYEEALNALDSFAYPVAIKADGLAAGKGVIIADSLPEARDALMSIKNLGKSGETIILEEFLLGREISFLAFCDGRTLVPMLPSEDHKQLYDGDKGPNTGGMGAITPLPWLAESDLNRIESEVVYPTWQGILTEGLDYRGILYIGLMLTDTGPKVLEYNARLGDPEAQVLLSLMKSDLVPLLMACCQGTLDPSLLEFHDGYAACVIAASPGYPQNPVKGLVICGLDALDPYTIPFYAGITQHNGLLLSSGGRVLALTTRADDLPSAMQRIYDNLANIHMEGMVYRRDIGRR